MGKRHHNKKGSLQFVPSKRAPRQTPRIETWPENSAAPKVMGFAGYKAGMTHAFIIDYRKASTTAGKEIRIPVTVLETPPIKVAAIRFYGNTPYGSQAVTEVWAENLDKELERRLKVPKKPKNDEAWKKVGSSQVEDIMVITYTTPKKVTGIPKKVPDVMEQAIKGGTLKDRIEYAKSILGKELKIQDFTRPGKMVDCIAVTKGKGFQGVVKRRGVKLLVHKNSKHRRLVGTRGPWHPNYVMWQVPQAGQTGYFQRTEYNKRVIKIGDKGEEIVPKGGFVNYGLVRNEYVLLHGSVPGPVKRLIRIREPIRFGGSDIEHVEITYVSKESQQGK